VFRRALGTGIAAAVVILLAVGISGQSLFANATDDELVSADAVVVLGGEHDGREAYGVALAQTLGARFVLLSNPYPDNDPIMRNLCGRRPQGIEVVCRAPEPKTTRGEAMMTRDIGRDEGWTNIAVVTWRFHLPRARIIFEECYSADSDRIRMHAVPIVYNLPIAFWEYIYLYQYMGLAKTFLQGSCSADG
jgi:uncharacterized SAM-binding protein YcdF (DUF218 family)